MDTRNPQSTRHDGGGYYNPSRKNLTTPGTYDMNVGFIAAPPKKEKIPFSLWYSGYLSYIVFILLILGSVVGGMFGLPILVHWLETVWMF